MKGAVQLKMESYWACLANGTVEADGRYWQAKLNAAFQSASKQFWQTVRRLRESEQYSTALVTSVLVGQWNISKIHIGS